MMDGQSSRQARKGTKSCTECRRRKVRCLRASEDSEVCRRCEERGSKCIPQGYTVRIRRDDKLPSRQRISQLELQVASLTKAVHGIESRLGNQPFENASPATGHTPESELYSDDSDDGSISDTLASEPSHLRSLFQNDWLSADVHPHDEHSKERKAKATGHILVVAKQALKKLIPSKSSLSEIPESAFKWLIFLDTLFPDKLAGRSRSDILESYEDMRKDDVDPVSLALWLLAVAITAQQVPDEDRTPSTDGKDYKRWVEFSQELSDTIERCILSHDRLVGTVQGLGIALHYFRLQISQGSFQKAWIRLRHYIVIAELMGLPKSRAAVLKSGCPDEKQLYKAQLWDSICAVDRLFGMVMNLAPGTTRYGRQPQPLLIDGVVQPWEYLSRLSDVAVRIQQLDEAGTIKGFNAEICTTALTLSEDLRTLSSCTPESWWIMDAVQVKPDNIVQLLHYGMLMRAYLPFTVHQNLSKNYVSARLSGMEVCESVVQRYLYLRQRLPPGFLLAQVLDLQAFTAAVVLLLTIHNSLGMDQNRLNSDRARIENEVKQVVEVMNDKSREMTGSGFAGSGAATIHSLSQLLSEDSDVGQAQELVLKAPLLGKVHVRRNPLTARSAPQSTKSRPTHDSSVQNHWIPNDQQAGLPRYDQPMMYPESQIDMSRLGQDAWPLDPFSWSIENNPENFFEDTLMTESFDQLATWQYGDTGFPI